MREARELLEVCETREPTLIENRRWLNLRLAVLMLDYIQKVVERRRRIIARLRYRISFARFLPESAVKLRHTIQHLKKQFESTEALLREIVWTRDKIFAPRTGWPWATVRSFRTAS